MLFPAVSHALPCITPACCWFFLCVCACSRPDFAAVSLIDASRGDVSPAAEFRQAADACPDYSQADFSAAVNGEALRRLPLLLSPAGVSPASPPQTPSRPVSFHRPLVKLTLNADKLIFSQNLRPFTSFAPVLPSRPRSCFPTCLLLSSHLLLIVPLRFSVLLRLVCGIFSGCAFRFQSAPASSTDLPLASLISAFTASASSSESYVFHPASCQPFLRRSLPPLSRRASDCAPLRPTDTSSDCGEALIASSMHFHWLPPHLQLCVTALHHPLPPPQLLYLSLRSCFLQLFLD